MSDLMINPTQTRKMGPDGADQAIPAQPIITLKLEKLTKGYKWEVKADCATDLTMAFGLITDGDDLFRARYGDDGTKVPPALTTAPIESAVAEEGQA